MSTNSMKVVTPYWWSSDNPKGRPLAWSGVPERLLHVLDLKPKA